MAQCHVYLILKAGKPVFVSLEHPQSGADFPEQRPCKRITGFNIGTLIDEIFHARRIPGVEHPRVVLRPDVSPVCHQRLDQIQAKVAQRQLERIERPVLKNCPAFEEHLHKALKPFVNQDLQRALSGSFCRRGRRFDWFSVRYRLPSNQF